MGHFMDNSGTSAAVDFSEIQGRTVLETEIRRDDSIITILIRWGREEPSTEVQSFLRVFHVGNMVPAHGVCEVASDLKAISSGATENGGHAIVNRFHLGGEGVCAGFLSKEGGIVVPFLEMKCCVTGDGDGVVYFCLDYGLLVGAAATIRVDD
jgi:hypothetical protein